MKLPRPYNSPAYRWLVKRSFTARRSIGGRIPDTVAARARSALGLLPLRWIDLAPLQLIRAASLEQLRDADYLERELLPKLGLSGDAVDVFPPDLRACTGRGLHHWQYPTQFAKYLAHLSTLKISTYLEIGVQHGGTFAITVEYLQRFHPVRAAYAVDVNRIPSLKSYAKENPAVRVLREDSSTARFRAFVAEHGPFGLVLIDGDHSEEGCRRDFEAVVQHATNIALHDIVDSAWPGVARVWRWIGEEYAHTFDFVAFTAQYEQVQRKLGRPCLGIGLAQRRA